MEAKGGSGGEGGWVREGRTEKGEAGDVPSPNSEVFRGASVSGSNVEVINMSLFSPVQNFDIDVIRR